MKNNPPKNRLSQLKDRENFIKVNFNNLQNSNKVSKNKEIEDKKMQIQQVKNNQIIQMKDITSTSWMVYNGKNDQALGFNQEQQRQVASLTKIMTTIISLELMSRYQLEKDIMIRISQASSILKGTTANLKQGLYIKLQDLFYGAMLPSGNDAAYLLAQVFGLLLFYENIKPESKNYCQIQSIDLTCYTNTNAFVNRFLKFMNIKAKTLKMKKTNFANPHGLINVLNVSSAKDMIILSRYSCENIKFREIMNTIQYHCILYSQDMKQLSKLNWINTNKLLNSQWQGIKTGQTSAAGCCLASLKDNIFIVVLNCKFPDTRFEETIMLYEWSQIYNYNHKIQRNKF